MPPLCWLVYGARGWIGGMLLGVLAAHRPDDRVVVGEARVDDLEAVRAELLKERPDRVVCLVGRTHGAGCATIDYLEGGGAAKTRENVRDNLFAPLALALLCGGIHLTYVGTGCIFSYEDASAPRDDEQWDAEASPNFFGSSYSVVKGYTDRLLHLEPFRSGVLNARIRMPLVGGDHPRNFVTKIASYARVIDVPNSVTVLDDLLPVLVDMAAHQRSGTWNFTNPGTVSHNQVLAMYKRYLAPSFEWQNFSLEEQRAILKAERSNNRLDATPLARLYPNMVLAAPLAVERMFVREAYRRAAGDERALAVVDELAPPAFRRRVAGDGAPLVLPDVA